MESLAFKGSISEAIVEAKKQRKLFVVYISGEDEESINLENSSWTESAVSESLSKYCVLLHIQAGSADAANFSAIYPQKAVPCITAIGYNGVQLWQNEGFVTAEVLASSLEKAWLSLQIQETTATVLTAALAAQQSEPSTSAATTVASNDEGSSSSIAAPPSAETHAQFSEPKTENTSELTDKDEGFQCRFEESSKVVDKTASKSFDGEQSTSSTPAARGLSNPVIDDLDKSNPGSDHISSSNVGNKTNPKLIGDKESKTVGKQFTSSTSPAKGLPSAVVEDLENRGSDNISSSIEGGCSAPKNTTNRSLGVPVGGSQLVGTVGSRTVKDEKAEAADPKKVDALDECNKVNKSSDAFLNIRLPNGGSLQEKFSVTSTLGMVKDYVDKNQESNIGSYDLAVPYPRKVFSDQDMSKSLSELGLFNRQALIVVPRQRGTSYHRGESSSIGRTNSTANADSSNGSSGGYFAYLRRVLSYANPFSYLGGSPSSSSSGEGSQDGMWEYRPNPTLQNNLSRTERPYPGSPPNQGTSATGRNDGKRRQPTTSQFGSNIHTLKHDEDDGRFNDRNSFWNGNSTQYGGNNNDGK